MAFVPPAGMHFQDPTEAYLNGTQHQYQTIPGLSDPKAVAYYGAAALPPQISCDIKPRLTKEQHDILEAHYQKQNKPNTNTKKGFAESLNVSLDKVNNWFQNRRAKSKQDAKKAGAYNMFPPANTNANFSDSDTSPAFVSQDYYAMMQQCASDDQLAAGFALGPTPGYPDPTQLHSSSLDSIGTSNQFTSGNILQVPYVAPNVIDSPQDMNRRTLTQEQFNALAQGGSMMAASGQYAALPPTFATDSDELNETFSGPCQDDTQQDCNFGFSSVYSDALSSNDSSIPSSISEHSLFPPSFATESSNLSASPDEWVNSRSSSMSLPNPADSQAQFPQTSTSQWQPNQSRPAELSELQQQFRDAQASQNALQQAQPQQAEQPVAWPDGDEFVRPGSQNSSGLTQQMDQFDSQAPQALDQELFKAPPPPASSIAARRHVKRPAALGIASLRSTSYSGNPGPASPGNGMKPTQQPLRRIQSSVAMNSVAQGRVGKSTVGAAQRSPLNFTFSESLNSPKALRHVSSSSSVAGSTLAPPTPLSPLEMTLGDPNASAPPPLPRWPSQVARHASISENDAEPALPYMYSTANTSQQNFSSPPHTPMFNQQYHQYMQGRLGNMILENTPPQSAPASQSCFPSNVFMLPQQMTSMPPPPLPQMAPPPPPPLMQSVAGPQAPQMISPPSMEQSYSFAMVPMQPAQQFMLPVSTQPQMPMLPVQYLPDGTVIDAQAQMQLMSLPVQPQGMQYMPQMPSAATQMLLPQEPMSSPPQGPPSYVASSSSSSPEMQQVSAPLPKPVAPTTELFVHEYSPPQDVKQAATPRKAVDMGPKNYTFANHGPEHFEKDTKSKKSSVASSSPESSTSN